MRLALRRDCGAVLGARGAATSRSRRSPTTAGAWPRARCSSASPASRATGTTSRPRRSRAAPSRSSSSARSGLGVPEVAGRRRCARRWRRGRRALLRRPDRRRCASSASPAPTARRRPRSWSRALLEAAGRRCGLLGTVKSVVGGARARRSSARRPRRSTCSATFRAMLDAGDARLRDGGLLARARAATASTAIHFAAAVFTNLTQDHLDFHATMEDYFQAKRRLFAADAGRAVAVVNVDDPYGRRLARASSPDAVTFAHRRARPTTARADVAARRRRAATSSRVTPDGVARAALAAARALQRRQRARRARPRRARSASPLEPIAGALAARRAACPAASSRSTRASRSRVARRLRAHARLAARTCCARRATLARRARCIVRVRLRRRPRPRQAPADGRRSPRGWPTSSIVTSDNPRSEEPGGDHRRDPRRHRRRPRDASTRERRPARGDRARDRARARRRRRRDRRQGPRAGPGVRGRPQGAVRRRRRSRARRCATRRGRHAR